MHTESWSKGLKPEATWKTRFTWEENVKEIRVGLKCADWIDIAQCREG
jgi:hypothetical protein